MNLQNSHLENLLLQEYSRIFKQTPPPPWAVRKKSNPSEYIHPSIPFVGKHYTETSLLLYASAENLAQYCKQSNPLPHLDNDSIAINRHRYCFENYSQGRFFPHLHLGPVNNGSLVVITAYLMMHLLGLEFNNPSELLEHIAVANFGKFSIASQERNIDYAGSIDKLSFSFEYVKADLTILRPRIIIIPKTIFNHKEVKELIFSTCHNPPLIIPIYQINPTTINTRITRFPKKEKAELPAWLVQWHESLPQHGNITGKIKENFYSVYSYLDQFLDTTSNPSTEPNLTIPKKP